MRHLIPLLLVLGGISLATRPAAAAVPVPAAPDAAPTHAMGAPSPFDAYWGDGFALPVTNNAVYALAEYAGGIAFGGDLTAAGLAHTHHVGWWDGSDFHALGDGVEGVVRALQPHGGGLVAGSLRPPGASTGNTIQSWNGTSWSVLGNTNGDVYALIVYGGDLVAGGSFTSVNGVAAAGVARWDGTAWSALGAGTGGTVRALAIHGGQLVAGGSLPALNGIAAWNGATWTQLGAGLQNGASAAVVKSLCSDGTTLFAVGQFTKSGATGCPNGAQWNGASWSGMANVTGTEGVGLWQGAPVTTATAVPGHGSIPCRWNGSAWTSLGDSMSVLPYAVLQSGGKLYLGTSSSSGPNSSTHWTGFFEFDGTTWRGVQRAWTPGMRGIGSGVDDIVAWNGELFVGGSFRDLGADDHFAVTNKIAAWDGAAWGDVGSPSPLGTSSGPYALRSWQGNLVAGGGFNANGLTYIGRWNGTAWSGFGATPLDNWVLALGTYGSDLIASGYFFSAGSTILNGIGRWDGASWQPLGFGFEQDLAPICFTEWNGLLVMGGNFLTPGRVPASRLATWNGTSYVELGGGIGDGIVQALTTYNDDVVAGGKFSTAGGVPVHNIARWNGSTWSAMGTSAVDIHDLQVIQGRLYAVGEFLAPDLITALAVWTGADWMPLGSGFDGGVTSLAELGGDIYVAGTFGWANGHPGFRLARFTGVAQLAVASLPAAAVALGAPHPNPARGPQRLAYVLPAATRVRLAIYDLAGRRVATLVDGAQSAGAHAVTWEGRDARAGMYLARLETPAGARGVRLVRLR